MKVSYTQPQVEVIELALESILCGSLTAASDEGESLINSYANDSAL